MCPRNACVVLIGLNSIPVAAQYQVLNHLTFLKLSDL